ncbi:MAG: 3,4-dehydroadipyl-CoA semialdehyde dehydrogenase [Planctomycetes bacterium]|nr:3,4-dehydroadipyl-CoA semialdehyde dehydrogenase [Planctomycetota bacterium]
MKQLRSYVAGQWVAGGGKATTLYNPTTEEPIYETSTEGVDLGAAVAHARARGLPALQELTFAQRAQALQAAANALHARRDELLDLAMVCGGNTRGDAKFDVDGALGTLAFYAKLGESLGATRFFVDGQGAQLGRSPKFHGEHLLVPRRGVAVHINAFNFPAWGLWEKAAVALLAGVPVITKPATSTAAVAVRTVEVVVEAGALPEGALQVIAGSATRLTDHLGPQDALAFTGSSDTAATLRAHEAFIRRGARINIEADSLNAAILGPDVEEGSETFDLFVREVLLDMTQKAGQKCTAIRRVFVPAARMAAARAALVEALSAIKTGDPSLREVKVGPVATAGQLRDVRAGVERLKRAATPVVGGQGDLRGALTGIANDKGYFVSPVLLEAQDAAAAEEVHRHEVFGPVATLLPYSGDAAEAARLVGLGDGGLVASIYSDDADVVGQVVLGMAPYNGRVNVGGAKVAEQSLGPGAVLPQLVHGGPGRAGGGEELGGLRGLDLYLQRTAVQGYKPLLEKLAGQGHRVG